MVQEGVVGDWHLACKYRAVCGGGMSSSSELCGLLDCDECRTTHGIQMGTVIQCRSSNDARFMAIDKTHK